MSTSCVGREEYYAKRKITQLPSSTSNLSKDQLKDSHGSVESHPLFSKKPMSMHFHRRYKLSGFKNYKIQRSLVWNDSLSPRALLTILVRNTYTKSITLPSLLLQKSTPFKINPITFLSKLSPKLILPTHSFHHPTISTPFQFTTLPIHPIYNHHTLQ